MAKLPSKTKARIRERAAKAREDFPTFVELIWRFSPLKHQRRWMKELKRVTAGELLELLFIAPRGGGKSAVVAVLFLAWTIGNNPDKHYGLISYGDKVAWRRSKAIRNIIQHDAIYHLIFPEIKPDFRNWSRESFTIQRGDTTDLHPTLVAVGSTGSIISSRLNGLVYDDPHDERNSKTPSKRRAVVETYDQAIHPCLEAGAWTVCIATRYADDDLPGVFINRGFEVVHQRAITQSYNSKTKVRKELSYAPTLVSLADLRKARERNPLVFALQMQGDTTGGTAAIIKKLHTYQASELPELKDLLIGAGTDTNYKDNQESDYTVIYIGGLDNKGNIWMLHREKGRWDVDDLAELLISLHKDWRYHNNWIEDTATGTPAVTTLRKRAAFVPSELQPASRGGKRSRASSIASYINSGQVKWPASAEWFRDAEYYLTHYGHTDFDDDLDAAYMLLTNLLTMVHPQNYGAGRPKRRVTIGGGRLGKKVRRRRS
jgi:predicted phage terminase large subunit-like protein